MPPWHVIPPELLCTVRCHRPGPFLTLYRAFLCQVVHRLAIWAPVLCAYIFAHFAILLLGECGQLAARLWWCCVVNSMLRSLHSHSRGKILGTIMSQKFVVQNSFLALPLQKSISAKHILHMICTEFKTHADCIYVQNVFPSMHAPWTYTKHIHIACAQLAPFCTHAKCVHLFTLF